ncbi:MULTISPECIES: hypothetical protein [Sinorhizobium]|uniref:hypothetical protein n=1 Tax=Sinorhizobium TaxID=28105 RepID=UPI001304DD9F|nr:MULTISPECIES: hypothetical protein [Sinorhizobium]
MPGFIHDLKHGISAISNHPVSLLPMKELISRPQAQKENRCGFIAACHRRVVEAERHGFQHQFENMVFMNTSHKLVTNMRL